MYFARILDSNGNPRVVRRLDETRIQPLAGNIFGHFWDHGQPILIESIRFLPPVIPSKVVGIGSNYKKHIAEMGRPTPKVPKIFLKPNTSVIAHQDSIEIPPLTTRVDHEAELGVVIGKHTFGVDVDGALESIFGLTIINDVTARDFQREDKVFTRGKGFNTFCPMGPWLLRADDENLMSPRRIQCSVNGVTRQDSNTRDMLFNILEITSFVSQVMTLLPGDVIATGTPSGVGPVQDGDIIKIEIENLGVLSNPVVNRSDRCLLS